ncbi:MAG: caspase family protein [Cyanobacteria bacterium P01_F01_bin.150]
MSKRRALLIGVPEYESEAIQNLPVVCNDLKLLHAALEKSGFGVRSLGEDGQSYCRSKILQALRRECREAKGLDVLLLYFSGHGLHFRGKDYLVPFDAELDDPEAIDDYLVPVDLSREIDQAQAKTIIFVVDACREGIKLDFKDIALAGWSRGEMKQATRRSFVVVFACGPGQTSQYVRKEQGFSLFSRALAEVIDPQHAACTLKEVLDDTQVRLNAIASEHNKKSQKIYYSFESAVEEDIASRVICDSVASIAARGQTTNPWLDAVVQSPLWPQEGETERCPVVCIKRQVTKIVSACWQQWQASVQMFPEDAWRDQNLPIRALELLGLVVPPSGLGTDAPTGLSLAETALIIAVPFVQEAILASGIVQTVKIKPLDLELSDLAPLSDDKIYNL